ncbi:hypothetical protein TIFTF001_016388 [Ficus carica]|uniref:Uncharacterized protein n=1 Tax=Ficus carica TaxID=3494 RepID=A0AA88A7H2_FICCA|nr:hypothetical protein TIFTF001_016388 [Ficus carica]
MSSTSPTSATTRSTPSLLSSFCELSLPVRSPSFRICKLSPPARSLSCRSSNKIPPPSKPLCLANRSSPLTPRHT